MAQEISGFTLFALCHNFGRRGRAMARSLAEQQDCPVPVRLVVFYSRSEDAALISEGAAAGRRPSPLTLAEVSPETAIQRALHFATAHRLHAFSHTVFTDSDLWFPPTFWRSYTETLQEQSIGYWSCGVKNIPFPECERFVEDWRNISEEGLEASSQGRRYENYAGKVGHFQCVPRELLEYPRDHRPSVDGVDLVFSRKAIRKSEDWRHERRLGTSFVYHLDHPQSWSGTGGAQL